MKLQALLIAVAMIAGGSAFAASDTAPAGDTTAKPAAGAPHKAKTTKTKHQTAHHGKTSHNTAHQAKASNHPTEASTHHMGANGHHMSTSTAKPETDLSARDRQGRVDDAYSKWRSNR